MLRRWYSANPAILANVRGLVHNAALLEAAMLRGALSSLEAERQKLATKEAALEQKVGAIDGALKKLLSQVPSA